MKFLVLLILLFTLTLAFEHDCKDAKRNHRVFIFDKSVHKSLFSSTGSSSPSNKTEPFSIVPILGNGYNNMYEAGQTFETATKIWTEILSSTPSAGPIYIATNWLRLAPGVLADSEATNVIFSCYSDEVSTVMEELHRRTGIRMPSCSLNLNFMLPEYSVYQKGFDIDKAHLKALGIRDTDQYFGRVDGQINFNTRFTASMDFDLSDGVSSKKTDFLSICLHEIGHFLGFRSAIDKVDNGGYAFNPTILDIYRFGDWQNVDFDNTFRLADGREGGHYIINPALTSMNKRINQFSTGIFRGDGNQASHWKADELTRTYLGIMDPTLKRGKHEGITDLDLKAMRMLGYSVDITLKPFIISGRRTLMNFQTSDYAVRFIAEFVFSEDLACILNEGEKQYSANLDEVTGTYWCPYEEEDNPRVFRVKGVLTGRQSDDFRLQ